LILFDFPKIEKPDRTPLEPDIKPNIRDKNPRKAEVGNSA
jgi:hypothetical protein